MSMTQSFISLLFFLSPIPILYLIDYLLHLRPNFKRIITLTILWRLGSIITLIMSPSALLLGNTSNAPLMNTASYFDTAGVSASGGNLLDLPYTQQVCQYNPEVLLQLGQDWWERTDMGGHTTDFGRIGGYYYKFYAVQDGVNAPVYHDKLTYIGAIEFLNSKLGGSVIGVGSYSLAVYDGDDWEAMVIIGPSASVLYSNLANTKYMGRYFKNGGLKSI